MRKQIKENKEETKKVKYKRKVAKAKGKEEVENNKALIDQIIAMKGAICQKNTQRNKDCRGK